MLAWRPTKGDADYTSPAEGDGYCREILADLKTSGYDGYISIEPHLSVVFHDVGKEDPRDPAELAAEQYKTYTDYGRALANLIADL